MLRYDRSCDDLAILIREAVARHRLHERQSSHRPLGDDYELIGLVGEYEFALWCRARGLSIELDTQRRPTGDGRIDFRLWGGAPPHCFTFDVKTAAKAYNLLREVQKEHSDILVLAQYDDPWATLLGWEYDTNMLRCKHKRFVAGGPRNYYLHRDKLRSMRALERVLRAWHMRV